MSLRSPLFTPAHVYAGNPDLRWRTIETEHFFVHYHAGDADFADRVALLAERAYRRLSVAYSHDVRLKVQVVLSDEGDDANGLANALPYPRIRLNVTAPGAMSVLSAYDDWIDILVTHELVHVIHLDTVHGTPRLINAVLGLGGIGRIVAPNILQPRWIIEGLATFEEGRQLTQGRERSALFDMLLRVAVLEGRFQTMDRVNSGARVFPHGTGVYLYGLHLIAYIGDRYGSDKLAELGHIYGKRLIPFGIDRALEDVIGVGFTELWDDFTASSTRRFRAQERQIRGRGLLQGRRLTFSTGAGSSGRHARNPQFSPNGTTIAWYEDDGQHRPGIRVMATSGASIREGLGFASDGTQRRTKQIIDVMDGTRASFVPGTSSMVFDMVGFHDLRYLWSDLYLWRQGGRNDREQLTFGLRAREPHVSPDGSTVAFVRNDSAQSRLAFLDLETRTVTEVAALERFAQVSEPRWSPDGFRVAVSMFREGGRRDIWVFDRRDDSWTQLTADRAQDQSPVWLPDGSGVMFTTDRSGVFNLHVYNFETQEVRQVTNVLGGAFEPDISADGKLICYVNYTSVGFDIWVMELRSDRYLEAMPGTMALDTPETSAPGLGGAAPAAGDSSRETRRPSARSRRYLAARTFFPRTIFPTALEFGSSSFLTDLGISAGISDVLGLHRLSGTFRYLSNYQAPTGSVFYAWSRRLPVLYAGFGRSVLERGGFERFVFDDGQSGSDLDNFLQSGYLEQSTRLLGGIDIPVIRHLQHSASIGLNYEWTRYANLQAGRSPIDPNVPVRDPPEVGDVAGISIQTQYSSVQRYRYSFYSERGRRLQVILDLYNRILGSDYGDLRVQGSYTEYIPMPWRGHQSLAFRFGGGASSGELERRGAFFVGGMSRDQDILRRLLTRSPIGEAGVLRGITPGAFSGIYYTVGNVEYRIPLSDVDRGIGSLPVFFERVGATVFSDVGLAWTRKPQPRDVAVTVGASLVFAFKLGFADRVDLLLQYAHGFHPEVGTDWFQLVVGRPF